VTAQDKQLTLARVLELHGQGRNAVEIGKSIGLTQGRVRAILRAEGIKANPMPEDQKPQHQRRTPH
jgi:hypothetical protein